MKRTVGKNTLGDNGKMKVHLHEHSRSTHDMGYIYRGTQAVGTLVPFMCEVGLRGDTWNVSLEASVLTHPTVGPLFGTFKLQMDVFQAPFRLYHGWLHNNKLGIGLKMNTVKLPLMYPNLKVDNMNKTTAQNIFPTIHPSALLAHLGLRGWGQWDSTVTSGRVPIKKNAIPLLAYWDIFKNYYANKQEANAYFIGSKLYFAYQERVNSSGTRMNVSYGQSASLWLFGSTDKLRVYPAQTPIEYTFMMRDGSGPRIFKPNECVQTLQTTENFTQIIFLPSVLANTAGYMGLRTDAEEPALQAFALKNIDTMRENILCHNSAEPFILDGTSAALPNPYKSILGTSSSESTGTTMAQKSPQHGLALKTYNSDIFNNWIDTTYIDGVGGINSISSVSVVDGKFSIDSLILAKKVYYMLNRIAISGGDYKSWLETTYSPNINWQVETPTYEGGAYQEIGFQEVISNAAAGDDPLGTLAGRGKQLGEMRGGKMRIRVDEPSYIMGIVSITPRLDYNQGNRFDTMLETMDDLHKPGLDGIGFQDLVTEKMAHWDVKYNSAGKATRKTVGKQVAWLDYMTNYNRTFGLFATEEESFMVLNRNYEYSEITEGIADVTTYIDPVKFNYIFAQTDITAMNFWVQIKVNAKVRRLISAKVIPNL